MLDFCCSQHGLCVYYVMLMRVLHCVRNAVLALGASRVVVF
jgi:hypothetical protein